MTEWLISYKRLALKKLGPCFRGMGHLIKRIGVILIGKDDMSKREYGTEDQTEVDGSDILAAITLIVCFAVLCIFVKGCILENSRIECVSTSHSPELCKE